MIQRNLFDQYKEVEVVELIQELENTNIMTREAELIESYQV